MRIAIAMRMFRNEGIESGASVGADPEECFADFEVQDGSLNAEPENDTVQVTVVLRGRRDELQNPALGVTELVLGALKAQTTNDGVVRPSDKPVIDAMGVAVTG